MIDDITFEPKHCSEPPPIIESIPLYPVDKLITESSKIKNIKMTTPTAFSFLSTLSPLTLPAMSTTTAIPTIPEIMLPVFTPMIEPLTSINSNKTFTSPWFISSGSSTSTLRPLTAATLPSAYFIVNSKPIDIVSKFETSTIQTPVVETTSIYVPINSVFDLLIMGNRTTPFFDRRRGEIIQESNDLICDFANNFPCLWGPESGKWAVIDRGILF